MLWHNEKRKLSQLVPYELNPRILSKDAAKRLKKSITETGYAEIIAIDTDNTIVAGHQRYNILKQINKKDIEIDVRVPERKLTDKEFKNYLIASNKDVGEWDYDTLSALCDVDELLEKGFSMEDLDIDITGDMETEGDDDAPQPPQEAKTVLGDIYVLGNHRLLCGDCTQQATIDILMGEEKVDALITDPPYGVDYSSKNEMLNNLDKGCCIQKEIKNDKIDDYKQFFCSFLRIVPFAEYNTAYIFMLGLQLHNLRAAIDECGMKWSDYLVWVKNNHGLGRKDYNAKHEFCFYGWKGKHKFYADGHRTTILEYNKPQKNELHPTMKPVELVSQLVQDGSDKNAIVYDPFGGSGSTLIACEKTNRRCYMMELEPIYCDVIVKRYIDFCNKNGNTPIVKRNDTEIQSL